jgi:hypothetical protein
MKRLLVVMLTASLLLTAARFPRGPQRGHHALLPAPEPAYNSAWFGRVFPWLVDQRAQSEVRDGRN